MLTNTHTQSKSLSFEQDNNKMRDQKYTKKKEQEEEYYKFAKCIINFFCVAKYSRNFFE
jgi:hypothetical protein